MLDILNTLARGGPVMIPLAVCSMLAATVLIERFLALRNADRGGEELILRIRQAYRAGDGAEALDECEQMGGPVANVLAAGLRAYLRGEPVTDAMQEQTLADQRILHRRLIVLDTVVTLAPLLGLLGTVLGMISAFKIISVSGTNHPAGITGGVAEALIATASGLAIAIVCLVGYNWCRDKLRQITEEIELRATQLESIVRGGSGAAARRPVEELSAKDFAPDPSAREREGIPVAH